MSVIRDIRWLDTLIGDDFDNNGNEFEHDVSVSGEGDVNDLDQDDNNSNKNDYASEDSNDNENDSKDNENNSKPTDIPKDQSHDETESSDHDEHDMVGNPKLQHELRKLNKWYNPTVDDLGDFAFIDGIDESYDNPADFYEAWDHPIGQE